jgi:hypothetical protein
VDNNESFDLTCTLDQCATSVARGIGNSIARTSQMQNVGSKHKKTIMDTDDLSKEAYKGIIIEAEKFNHDLTLQFGVLASRCKNEKDYLSKAALLIKKIQRLDRSELTDIFFDSIPDKKHLDLTLEKMLANISKVEMIPENKRHYDF